jgi:chorismate mutase
MILTEASRALAEARSLDEIRFIRNKAEAARQYARSAALGLEIQNFAAEVKLRAERKAGRLLAELKLRGGDRRSKLHDATLKLEEIGLSRIQSARWQLEAIVPDEVFEAYVAKTQQDRRELTANGLMRLAKIHRSHKGPAPHKGGTTAMTSVSRRRQVIADSPALSSEREQLILEQLGELKNHFGLLAQTIQPLLQKIAPANVERRLGTRLIFEIESLLRQIDDLLRDKDR